MTPQEKAQLLFKQDRLSGTKARYQSMNNVHAQSAQRPPGFECYASRATQPWPSSQNTRAARRKRGHCTCFAMAHAVETNDSHSVRPAA